MLPPKPKPGRKPAIDTPPTKRKAQNREAQRAFRERRAAKVGELEEEMKKMEEEDEREQESLRERIRQLEKNMEDYGKMIETWRDRFIEMQIACGRERQLREVAEAESEKIWQELKSKTEAVPLPSRSRRGPYQSDPDMVSKAGGTENENDGEQQIPMTCGRCSIDTRCQCIEDAFEIGTVINDPSIPAFKRPHSPQRAEGGDSKRIRQEADDNSRNEIDFTSQFATTRPPPNLTTSTSTASSTIPALAPPDPCGFCSDGTPCICAEVAKESARQLQDNNSPQSVQKTNSNNPTDPCANGPGTCAQCRSNPLSTLFCKSVAANRSSVPNGAASSDPVPASGPNLTCADAFTTLSRHPAFSAATDEFNSWIPQLTAIPKASNTPERTAFDIEAASVMAVLKVFDRRFGSVAED